MESRSKQHAFALVPEVDETKQFRIFFSNMNRQP